jgi:cyanate lyase
MLTRSQVTEAILEAKMQKGITFARIAEATDRSKEWTTAALLGQETMSAQEADAVVQLLELDPAMSQILQQVPMRGSLDQAVPTDPVIYRLYEVVQVYGTTIKALIHEMFGDGIMSAIDFEMDIQRKKDPKGDRVVITLDGKFLPYRKW